MQRPSEMKEGKPNQELITTLKEGLNFFLSMLLLPPEIPPVDEKNEEVAHRIQHNNTINGIIHILNDGSISEIDAISRAADISIKHIDCLLERDEYAQSSKDDIISTLSKLKDMPSKKISLDDLIDDVKFMNDLSFNRPPSP
jgi:hypothetical protein